MKSATLYVSVEKPKLDLFDLTFNHRVKSIIEKIKTIDKMIVDCWAVDMSASTDKNIAIIASLHDVKSVERVKDITDSVLKIEHVTKVKYNVGESMIY